MCIIVSVHRTESAEGFWWNTSWSKKELSVDVMSHELCLYVIKVRTLHKKNTRKDIDFLLDTIESTTGLTQQVL